MFLSQNPSGRDHDLALVGAGEGEAGVAEAPAEPEVEPEGKDDRDDEHREVGLGGADVILGEGAEGGLVHRELRGSQGLAKASSKSKTPSKSAGLSPGFFPKTPSLIRA